MAKRPQGKSVTNENWYQPKFKKFTVVRTNWILNPLLTLINQTMGDKSHQTYKHKIIHNFSRILMPWPSICSSIGNNTYIFIIIWTNRIFIFLPKTLWISYQIWSLNPPKVRNSMTMMKTTCNYPPTYKISSHTHSIQITEKT